MILKENVDITSELSELLDEYHVESRQEMPFDFKKEHFSFGLYIDDKLIGGLTATFQLGEFFIPLLAVSKAARRQGIGRRLMLAAEEKSKELGAQHMLLTTFSYQGPDFYSKIGFEELTRISDFPASGVDKIYFIKYFN